MADSINYITADADLSVTQGDGYRCSGNLT